MEGWPDAAQALEHLKREAGTTAKRLGHVMTDWVKNPAGGYRSRCVNRGCNAAADIAPRTLAAVSIRGVAVQLRCR